MKSMQARNSFMRGLAAVAAVFTLMTGTAVAQQPIKIGAFLSVTGGAAFLGDPEQKTLELYVEKVNAAGGVLGRSCSLLPMIRPAMRKKHAPSSSVLSSRTRST